MGRNRLHKNKLNDFIEYMEWNDWERVDTKGAYEVARLIHAEFVPVIVHKKASAKEHLTVHGEGERWVTAFIRDGKIPNKVEALRTRIAELEAEVKRLQNKEEK
jgi:hypothetical protein